MNESFVIAVFVARAELQVAVEKEAEIILEASEDEMLVARVASKDDVVGVDVVFGGGGDAAGGGPADSEAGQENKARDTEGARARQLGGKQIGSPERDTRVDKSKEHGGADETEARNEENWKKQRSTKRAEVIKRKNV